MDGIKIMDLKNASFNKKYLELKERFEKRPPRDQDLELITQLKEELKIKEKLCEEAELNMEKFRNLLLNNEENYNKIFNSNPKTGSILNTKKESKHSSKKLPK